MQSTLTITLRAEPTAVTLQIKATVRRRVYDALRINVAMNQSMACQRITSRNGTMEAKHHCGAPIVRRRPPQKFNLIVDVLDAIERSAAVARMPRLTRRLLRPLLPGNASTWSWTVP